MKDLVINKIERNRSIVGSFFCVAAGFIFSGGNIFESLFPFLPAFWAAASPIQAMFALLGGTLGCIVFSPVDLLFSYISTYIYIMLAKLLIKLIFKKENVIINCSVVFFSCLLRVIFSAMDEGFYLPEIVLGISECIMAIGFCYFFTTTLSLIYTYDSPHIFTSKEQSALLISSAALIISLNSFSIADIHLGTICAVIIILAFSYIGSSSAVIVSVVLSISLTMNNVATLPFFSVVPATVLLISPTRRLGRYPLASLFMMISTILSLLLGIGTAGLSLLLEAVIGTVIFAFIPQKILKKFIPIQALAKDTTVKNIISDKLKNASSSMSLLADALEALSPKKNISMEISNNDIISETVNKVCNKCRSASVCWGNNYNDTTDILNKAINSLKMGVKFHPPAFFMNSCCQHKQIFNEIALTFQTKKENRKQEGKLLQVKNAVSESYRSLSYLLEEFSSEIDTIYYPNSEGDILLKNALNAANLNPVSSSAVILNGGKTVYEFLLESPADKEKLDFVISELSEMQNEKYSVPSLSSSENGYLYSFSESENYSFSCSEIYLNKKSEDISGDKICEFSSKDGFQYMLLCDGMGCGKYAAREAEIAAVSIKELICGGLTHRAAVKTVGSMLLSQEKNESSCAVDIVKIDKYTAEAAFFKAGGAPTLIRHDGRVSVISDSSMPIGIIGDMDYCENKIYLSAGDLILLLSDGITENGTDWLSAILSQKRINTPAEVKTAILNYVEKNGITFTDDATIGIILTLKN